MSKLIRIATLGVADDYRQSLVPLALSTLGYHIEWCARQLADLLVLGPFYAHASKKNRYLPKPLRPLWNAVRERVHSERRVLTLFQTGENLRPDSVPSDYALSFDLAIESSRHCRMPYWMEMVDWSHEGVRGNSNPRFGQLLDLQRLRRPLGRDFLQRPQQAALFASHLREPRATLYQALLRVMPVQGWGPHFDSGIQHHSASGILKQEVLKNFAYNLCPENSMYPGYYTEKIPEAFMAGCLPITWADSNLAVDFNPAAVLNLAPMMHNGFQELAEIFHHPQRLEHYAEQALITHTPSIAPLLSFLKNIADEATS